MRVLKNTPCVEFNPNTIGEIREEFNLNQDGIDKMLDNFQNWIAKQHHFTKKDFSRIYLESSLIYAKGSLERAKSNLDKLCTLKTLLPTFFEKHDVKKEFKDITGFVVHGSMPKLLKNNYRLLFLKLVSSDFDAAMFLDFNRYNILMCEYVKIHDYILGAIIVIDCRDVNLLSFVTKVNIIDLRNTMSVVMEGYGLRIKNIYVISESKTVDIFLTLLRQVLNDKIAARISVVKTVEALYEHVPKESLPKEYGGEQKALKEINEIWTNVLSTKENVEYFKEISQAKTNEKYRLPEQYNEQVLGMPGSFRTLTVD